MKNKNNYQMVSLLQFVFAILVIMLHSSRVFQNDAYHFIQKSIFSRMAVPFFVVCSSFFVRKKTSQNSTYQNKYLKNYVKTYLVWSAVFIPYGLFYFSSLSLPPVLIPLGLLVALLYTGICYHLWYIPAVLTGTYLVNRALRRVRFKYTIFLSLVLFAVGSIETYSAFFENTKLLSIYESYASVFFTSRNGLFFIPIFVCIGYLLYDYREHTTFTQHYLIKLLVAFLALCLEGFIIFPKQGIDKNFLFALIPFSMFLFNWAIRTELFRDKSFYKLKQLSTLYFFIHPIFIEIISIPALVSLFKVSYFGWIKFLFTLISTHLLSLVILKTIQVKRKEQKVDISKAP